jgi:hypothetical protein
MNKIDAARIIKNRVAAVYPNNNPKSTTTAAVILSGKIPYLDKKSQGLLEKEIVIILRIYLPTIWPDL